MGFWSSGPSPGLVIAGLRTTSTLQAEAALRAVVRPPACDEGWSARNWPCSSVSVMVQTVTFASDRGYSYVSATHFKKNFT